MVVKNEKKTPNRKFQVAKDSSVSRTFSYKKGDVTLNFTLRTDIKTQLQDFEACLEQGLDDVREAMKI